MRDRLGILLMVCTFLGLGGCMTAPAQSTDWVGPFCEAQPDMQCHPLTAEEQATLEKMLHYGCLRHGEKGWLDTDPGKLEDCAERYRDTHGWRGAGNNLKDLVGAAVALPLTVVAIVIFVPVAIVGCAITGAKGNGICPA